MSRVKPVTGVDVDAAYAAAQAVVETHRRLADWLKIGVTCRETDLFIAEQLYDLGGRSCFLRYRPKLSRVRPFPSHACHSLNDCIVHGTATSWAEPIVEGDVYSIDIGIFLKSWVGDAAWTYVFGEPTDEVRRLCDCGKESLRLGVEELRPGNTYLAWAEAVAGHVEDECGYHLVKGLSGHGIGKGMLHGKPTISNIPLPASHWPEANQECLPGTLIAVEPMIAIGTGDTRDNPNAKTREDHDWPILSADGSLAVHYEHDVLITEDGPRVLSHGLEDLKDVIT